MSRTAGAVATGLLEALWTHGDEDAVRAGVADDFRFSLSSSGESMDVDGYLATMATFRSAFSPIDLIFHCVLVEDERVFVHYSITGMHTGEVLGIAPTGHPRWVEAMTLMRFRDGRPVRQLSVTDFASLRRQLQEAP